MGTASSVSSQGHLLRSGLPGAFAALPASCGRLPPTLLSYLLLPNGAQGSPRGCLPPWVPALCSRVCRKPGCAQSVATLPCTARCGALLSPSPAGTPWPCSSVALRPRTWQCCSLGGGHFREHWTLELPGPGHLQRVLTPHVQGRGLACTRLFVSTAETRDRAQQAGTPPSLSYPPRLG